MTMPPRLHPARGSATPHVGWWRRFGWLVALLAPLLPGPLRAQLVEPPPAELWLLDLPAPAGLARLLVPERGGSGLVLLVPDVAGEDGRGQAYADRLLAQGLAVLQLGLDAPPETGAGEPVAPAASAAAIEAALTGLAALPTELGRFARVGVLGFGAGGAAALRFADRLPVAALYPDCRAVAGVPGAVLVVIGLDSGAAPGCVTLAKAAGWRLLGLRGAAEGWDLVVPDAQRGRTWLPDADGRRGAMARPDPGVTLWAADAAAGFFARLALPDDVAAAR